LGADACTVAPTQVAATSAGSKSRSRLLRARRRRRSTPSSHGRRRQARRRAQHRSEPFPPPRQMRPARNAHAGRHEELLSRDPARPL